MQNPTTKNWDRIMFKCTLLHHLSFKLQFLTRGCHFIFMILHTFSIGNRCGLKAGQASTRTLCLWRHAVVAHAHWRLTLSCWNIFLGKDVTSLAWRFSKIPIYTVLHTNATRSCCGHWCTLYNHHRCWSFTPYSTAPKTVVWMIFRLWQGELDVDFSLKL